MFQAGRAPARATVVLLHSSAGSSRQWSALSERLSAHFDVRAIDFHGHGSRAAWSGAKPLTLADEVALVEPILESAGQVHLVGHSYGGAVALKAAALHPAAVASVAVFEPVLFRWLFEAAADSAAAREVRAVAETMRKFLDRGDAWRAAAPFLNYWTGVGTWESMSIERRDSAALRMRSVMAHFDALFGDPLAARDLQRFHKPMLFLSGTWSVASMRELVPLVRAALPDAEHAAIPGLGHLGPVTHAAVVNGRIAEFLDRIQAGEGRTERLRAAA